MTDAQQIVAAAPAVAPHRHAPMTGRDPHEKHRAATPLELLFDLTFVIGFGIAAERLAHFVADGHLSTALLGFGFSMFAICWAWINFSWFSSAYDTDDWIFRLATMVQMVGVIVLSLGIARVYASIDAGAAIDNGIVVLGYVVMRLAMVFLWLRAARQDPARRRACLTYAASISLAQIGWIAQIFVDLPLWPTLTLSTVLMLIELAGPVIAERHDGGTPWHAHHIAERYSLLAIIALGEGVVGTVASVSAIVQGHGWSAGALIVCASGIGLTFGMWWLYFFVPSGEILHAHRERAFVWGYGHMIIFAAIAATGAGLHVAGLYLEGKAHIGPAATIAATAVPVGAYAIALFALYIWLVRASEARYLGHVATILVVLGLAVGMAAAGVNLGACLIVATLAPATAVVAHEVGHRRRARELAAEVE